MKKTNHPKKDIFKRGAALATGAALTLTCLTGCGGASGAASSTVSSTASSAAGEASSAASTAQNTAAAVDGSKLLDPSKPVAVTIWNYYNGDQLAAFESLVAEFNETVGTEKGIIVTSVSQGNVDDLANALIDAVDGKVGADNVPSAAAVYAETAYIMDGDGMAVALEPYFTAEELSGYVDAFLEEGRMRENGELITMPVSKSTEIQITNTTDWAPFAEATGITQDSVKTLEDMVAAAETYYNWTDEQTPDVPEDGKALFGRDSIGNYIFVGTKQLGHEMFTVDETGKLTVDMDRDTFKTLWDNYYIPYINGYFASYGKFRSEDLKTGSILTLVGSSSGVSYYADTVTDENDATHPIELSFGRAPVFANAVNPVSVQQGAGYCVLKTSEAEQYAAVEFLKWFTDTAQNLNFSINSGYSPVKKDANDAAKIEESFTADSPKRENMLKALLVSAEVYTEGNTYTNRPFEGSKEMRTLLDKALTNICTTDRAAVAAAIAAGQTRAEAVAPYSTDEYFDAWFNDLCTQVSAITG